MKLDLKCRTFATNFIVTATPLADMIALKAEADKVSLRIPATAVPFLAIGDTCTVSLTFFRVGIEQEPEPGDGIIKPAGLLLPNTAKFGRTQ